MTDVLTKEQRSFNMSRIKARDTMPELKLRDLLVKARIKGYRTRDNLPGRPDLVFRKAKLAVFIDGCFWHKCPRCFVRPETRTEFWMRKITGNVNRDKEINIRLKRAGWKILRLWEHEIKKTPKRVISKIIRRLESGNKS